MTKPEVEWTLLFTGSNNWFFSLFKPGFQHVRAVRDYGSHYLLLEPTKSHIHIELLDKRHFPDLHSITGIPTITVTVHASIDTKSISSTLCFNTCVDTMKRLLGIKKRLVLTPFQLFKHLTNEV